MQIPDDVGLARAHFVGNSWSGMTGGTFAARYPDRIGRADELCLLGDQDPAEDRVRMLNRARYLFGGPLEKPVIDAFVGPAPRASSRR